jgi:hypothetical protein
VNKTLPRRLLRTGLALVLWTATSTGLASTVLLVRPPNPSSLASEALVRMHGELASAGFDVSFAAAMVGMDARASLEMLASSPGVDAVVAILGDESPDMIEVWVADRLTGGSLVRRTPYHKGGDRDAEVLAIRAIELLRASLLEADMAGRTGPEAKPEPVAQVKGPAPEPHGDARFGFEVGGNLVTSFDGVGPAFLPLLRIDGAIAAWCVAQASIAGLGTRAHVGSPVSSAQISQQFATAGVTIRARARKRVRPAFSLALGALHTSAEGRADWPYDAWTAAKWSFLADLGVGVRLFVVPHYEVAIEAHGQLAEPYPVVRFLDANVASTGRPTLLFTLALVAWL